MKTVLALVLCLLIAVPAIAQTVQSGAMDGTSMPMSSASSPATKAYMQAMQGMHQQMMAM